MIQPFDAYQYYQALKLHFDSDSYDAFKYNFRTSAKPQTFWKRNDKYYFAKVANRFSEIPQMIQYYAAHFVNDNKWIGEMLANDETYNKVLKRHQSLSYTFEQDINKLAGNAASFNELFVSSDSPYPKVIASYLQGDICIETVIILNKLTSFMNKVKVDDTILWPEISKKILKYDPFVQVNLDKMKKIVLKVFTS